MFLNSSKLKQYFNELIERGVEILHLQACIKTLDETNSLTVYCGYEVSGKPHLGTILTFSALHYFSLFDNVKVYCLLADLHTMLNQKQDKTEELLNSFLKIYPDTKINFISGYSNKLCGLSGFQKSQKYIKQFYEFISQPISLKKIIKSTELELRSGFEELQFSKLIYPILQVIDISFLDVDLAIGGMDQRKIHMLHSDKTKKDVTYLHIPLITLNNKKVSKSDKIFLDAEKLFELFDKSYKAYIVDLALHLNPNEKEFTTFISKLNEIK